jgi:predicted dinucleotide-binding enzyme
MSTAIVGVGEIGGALARHLVAGGESVVIAAKSPAHAKELKVVIDPSNPVAFDGRLVDLDEARAAQSHVHR